MFSRLKKRIKTFVYFCILFLDDKKIILESSPDYSDNTKYVFDELIKRGVNKDCRIYWATSGSTSKLQRVPNVFSVRKDSFRYKLIHNTAKFIIDSNDYVLKTRKNQFRIHLTHGMVLKMPYEYASMAGEFNYCSLLSEYFLPIYTKLYDPDKSKYAITGLPRNDGLTNDLHISGKKPDARYILWLPTFRRISD